MELAMGVEKKNENVFYEIINLPIVCIISLF